MPMHRVASFAALRSDRGHQVDVNDTPVLLVRDGDTVRAYGARCPHAGAPLAEGAVCNGRIVCPWHKATFALSDGALLEPPALEGLAAHPVQFAGDDILVSADPIARPPVPPEPDRRTMLVLGAGAAGTAAAAALRDFGFGGRIALIGREPGSPYDRTALSKFVTAGQMPPDEIPPLRPDGFYARAGIERLEAEIVALDPTRRVVTLDDGRTFGFDAALIATGSTPNAPDVPGADLAGVHVLRSRDDARSLLAELRPGTRAVVLGSSFIGLEVACSLREQGIEVAIVSPEPVPFTRQLGERIGGMLRTLHEAHGVRFYTGKPARIAGAGRVDAVMVDAVVMDDGRRLPADVVVVGLGVRPATGFVQRGGGALAVDATLRLADGVYAAGDVAEFPLAGAGKQVRIEHWRVAQQHGRIAARGMLGEHATYDGVPFFWTYHYGKRFEYLGHAETWDDEVVHGDLDTQNFVAFLLRQGMVAAVVACGHERATAFLTERMRAPLSADAALAIVRGAGS